VMAQLPPIVMVEMTRFLSLCIVLRRAYKSQENIGSAVSNGKVLVAVYALCVHSENVSTC